MENYCQRLQDILQQTTGYKNTTVRSIGGSLYITVRASPQTVLDAVFVPFIEHKPRWEVKAHGWHHIFFTHQGLETVKYNHHVKTGIGKRLTKTDRGESRKEARKRS